MRPFNTFGPRCHHEGDSGEVIPKFLLRAQAGLPLVIFGDGKQTRDFTYVSDTARGVLLAGTLPAAVGRTFNLGSGREVSINSLARLIAWGAPVIREAPRPGDVHRLLADATLAREVLGFEPRVGLDQGFGPAGGMVRPPGRAGPGTSETGGRAQLALGLKRIPVGRPEMDEREVDAARRAILSGWITMGPEVAAFRWNSRRRLARGTPVRSPAARPLCTWRC